MMNTYLGEEPDTLDALEFLCLAEGGEVTHYEVLSKFIPKVKISLAAHDLKMYPHTARSNSRLCRVCRPSYTQVVISGRFEFIAKKPEQRITKIPM